MQQRLQQWPQHTNQGHGLARLRLGRSIYQKVSLQPTGTLCVLLVAIRAHLFWVSYSVAVPCTELPMYGLQCSLPPTPLSIEIANLI